MLDSCSKKIAQCSSSLCTQALRSEDKALLERCLAVSAAGVIANTVARLQPLDALALLTAGVARLQSRPRRAQQLVPWLQALLLPHAAYFIAAPGRFLYRICNGKCSRCCCCAANHAASAGAASAAFRLAGPSHSL